MKLTREKAKALLDSGVLQAYANGETIELLHDNGKVWTEFGPDEKMLFDCDAGDYRVKQKYREVTDNDIGKEIEVSVKNDYVKRKFVVKHNGKFYCEVDGEPEHLYGWRFARVPNE